MGYSEVPVYIPMWVLMLLAFAFLGVVTFAFILWYSMKRAGEAFYSFVKSIKR